LENNVHEIRLTHWTEIINQQLESGMSKRSWCRSNGINEKQFFYWQRRIRNNALSSQASITIKDHSIPSNQFVEVPICSANSAPAPLSMFQPSAVLCVGTVTVGITESISEDLLMKIGRMIRSAL